jgi:hypothetical protein
LAKPKTELTLEREAEITATLKQYNLSLLLATVFLFQLMAVKKFYA